MHPDFMDSDDPRDEMPGCPPHDDDFEEMPGKGQPDWLVYGIPWYKVNDRKEPGQ